MNERSKPNTHSASPTGVLDLELAHDADAPEQVVIERNQTSNGRLLAAMFRRLIRYCYPAKKWFVFNGARWQPDTGGVMARAAKQTVETLREIAGQIEAGKDGNHYRLWAQQSQSLSQQQAMLTQAQSEPGISIQPDAFDQDSWLLGCPNGTLELRTRTFRPSRPDDYISKVCGIDYDPAATCPNWDAFL